MTFIAITKTRQQPIAASYTFCCQVNPKTGFVKTMVNGDYIDNTFYKVKENKL